MQRSLTSELFNGLKLRPEERFIINCLRSEFNRENNDNFAKVALSNIDWNMVYEISAQWRITSLLYKIIEKRSSIIQFPNIPQYFFQKMEGMYIKILNQNRICFERLIEILKVFNKVKIKVILLKGSHLAQFIYQDIGIRSMADIDILVKKDDLDKVEGLLLQMGYDYPQLGQTVYDFFKVNRDTQGQVCLIERYKTNHYHLYPLSDSIKHLEIHWTIVRPTSPFNIDIAGLWKRAKKVEVSRTNAMGLSPEDLLLHHSLHTSYSHKYNFRGIKQLYDIATIIDHYAHEIDWDQLQLRAYEWGIEKYLYLTLRLSQEILGASVPDSILHDLKPKLFNEKIVLEAQRRILSNEINKFTTASINSPEKFYPDISLSEKISYIFHRIFIPSKELAFQYSLPASSKRLYFYYFVRFISLLYHKTPRYAKFFLYLLTHKKADFFNFNLDTWLIPSDSEMGDNSDSHREEK